MTVSDPSPAAGRSLGRGPLGFKGVVTRVDSTLSPSHAEDLERRLLEMGFVEGAKVEIIHVGPFGADPIAVRVDDMRVALRRREAEAVLVETAQ